MVSTDDAIAFRSSSFAFLKSPSFVCLCRTSDAYAELGPPAENACFAGARRFLKSPNNVRTL